MRDTHDTNERRPRVLVATPYSEGSILAIAEAAAEKGQLTALFTNLHLSRFAAGVRFIPARTLRRRVQSAITRRSFSSIPPERIKTVAQLIEGLHLITRGLPGSQALSSRMMYRAKRSFDCAVAERIGLSESDAVVTMVASAERTLRAARETMKMGVLNFLASHPVYQNLYLKELAGLPERHHELVPEGVAKRVEKELELADLVLVPSQFVANQLFQLGVARGKVAVRPYGVDLGKFRPPPGPVSRRTSVIRCLYLGQIAHRKGIKFLLDAARRLSDRPLEFILIGPLVSPELLQNMPANVRWLGATAHDDVAEILRQAQVFVLPSLEDAYGLVTLEAMATGLPVVVSDHAGASELITNGVDGLIVPAGQVTAMVEAFQRLVDDQSLRTSMGSAARQRIEKDGSWYAYGLAVLDLIGRRSTALKSP